MLNSELFDNTRLPTTSMRPAEEPGEIAPKLVTLPATEPEPVSSEFPAMRKPDIKTLVPPRRLNSAVCAPSPTTNTGVLATVPKLLCTRPWLKMKLLMAFTCRFDVIKVPPDMIKVPFPPPCPPTQTVPAWVTPLEIVIVPVAGPNKPPTLRSVLVRLIRPPT